MGRQPSGQLHRGRQQAISYATVNRWEFGHFEPTIKPKRKLAPYFKKYKIEID